MTTGIDGLAAQAPYNPTTKGASDIASKGALDKDAFMRLLVAQLANQDPMSPSDPSQFVAQLSQFSSLEQLVNLKDGMDLLAVTETAGTSAQMVSFIGKSIQFGDAPIPWKPGQAPVTTRFELPESAADVTVRIVDAQGNEIEKRSLGARPGGEHAFTFDGTRADGTKLAEGTYHVELLASDADGNAIGVKQWSQGVVTGVTFEAGYPQLMLADGRTIGLSQVFEVGSSTASDSSNDTDDSRGTAP
ncbi:MAG: flagellar hook assembly protein FlgD [Deltaproteobacteria bacterium]|nr:flagellar hook assembly protein FlgD [Deltaproteobacteria bacterium]